MDIFYLIPYVPNQIRVRPHNIIKRMAQRGHRITLFTLWSGQTELDDLNEIKQYCDRVFAYPLTKMRSGWNAVTAVPTNRPLQAVYCWQPQLFQQLLHELEKQPPDILHIEHLRGSLYGIKLREELKHKQPRLPVIWDSVDCITYLFRQAVAEPQSFRRKIILGFEIPRTDKYEQQAVQTFTKTLVTSELDRQALLSLLASESTQGNIQVVPNGVNLEQFTPNPAVPRTTDTIIVSGKMSYHANIRMVLHLHEAIMPHVWKHKPDVKLLVVGKDPPPTIRSLHRPPRVTVTGTVPELHPYLQAATLAVAPIAYGAGIQNKVLEAMACETPVVATSKAVAALQVQPDRNILIADDPYEFALHIIELLNNPAKRDKIAQEGRLYIEEWYNWDTIAANLEQIYSESIESLPSLDFERFKV